MLEKLRTLLHRAITTPRGDTYAVVRVPKGVASGINDLLGAPLCSMEEIERRRAGERRLVELRTAPPPPPKKREPAPVMVYFEKDRNARLLERVRETLDSRNIVYKLLDVAGDVATMSFVTTEAKCEDDDLPVIFVAGKALGGFNELVAANASGELMTAVFGK